ncbi:Arginine--tRNA ligase [Nymphaea thermarum]|nr:Arginine--tRNA ligase [Nymphaea thermarum]
MSTDASAPPAIQEQAKDETGSVKQLLSNLFRVSLKETIPDEPNVEPLVAICTANNNAMSLWSKIKGKTTQFRNPNAIGQSIAKNLPASEMIESTSVAGPGFVNVMLSNKWIAKRIEMMLANGIDTWAPVLPVKRAIVDFSSPNIAKEMHVGHLRSTIIGDSISRMLEFCKADVLRRNHVGDWGTQFGMLIEYLFEKFPNWEDAGEQAIGDLQGESFYNPYIPGVLEKLHEKGLIEESEGARVIFIEGQNIPLIVVKRDGGYNYASTDLSALWYRLNEEKAEWIIYVTDVGQSQHFEMFFAAAKRAGWLPVGDGAFPKVDHVGFGLVLGSDGKRFRTRSTEVVRLFELLDEAKNRSKEGLVTRGREEEWTAEELEHAAEAIGYGAIKYADLKNNRLTNYTFNYEQMLDVRGNTAVYLLYAHARICSIIRKSGKDIEELKNGGRIHIVHDNERILGIHLIQFSEIVEDAVTNLLPNTLCEYLYNLSENFTKFYSTCRVVGSEEETSRLLLCEATAVVMRICFRLLGIVPLYKL